MVLCHKRLSHLFTSTMVVHVTIYLIVNIFTGDFPCDSILPQSEMMLIRGEDFTEARHDVTFFLLNASAMNHLWSSVRLNAARENISNLLIYQNNL